MSAGVTLQDVSCIFPAPKSPKSSQTAREVRAVDGVSLEIRAGEFFTLLGPSGSGKTTCLRMIGGFALPTHGKILIDGQDVSQLPPFARPVNTVFQDYALFPHMTIAQNVAYGLMVKGVNQSTRAQKAQTMLELVALPDVGNRRPMQLSGGQRQRVALARALINEPKVLLLDEPLGALDLKLREQMQSELKALQRKLGITFLFITHDQHEALSMSDRVGIFNSGKLEQVGTPRELYEEPTTKFVAQFLGAANVLEGELAQQISGQKACMMRPERIVFTGPSQGQVAGLVQEVQYFGSYVRVGVEIDAKTVGEVATMSVDMPAFNEASIPQVGKRVGLNWDAFAVHSLATAP